ncbi:MAG: hypothetical protein KJ578_12745 [Bacteroidetes bacterium]|nr:hypothetical protein [Bacteroidota bacterium]MBU1577814.1 hypothetical protein [Bacteroidota bacterium]MBU2558638.1 hypothetical protein [Bacteroidota bacterium]
MKKAKQDFNSPFLGFHLSALHAAAGNASKNNSTLGFFIGIGQIAHFAKTADWQMNRKLVGICRNST